MRYRELTPAPALRRHVRCYWMLDAPAPPADPPAERVLPDGCVEMILNLDAPFERRRDDGTTARQPRELLIGPMTRYIAIRPTGVVRLVGIRFQPGGAAPFVTPPLDELRDATPELTAATSWVRAELSERLALAARSRERAAVLDDVLSRYLARRGPRSTPDPRLAAAVSLVVRLGGNARVDALAQATGLGVRQLERRFVRAVGFGPKTLSRLARFQRAVRAIDRASAPRWSRIAVECGYADQAHFAREFREFAGVTAGAFARERHPMSDHFTSGDAGDGLGHDDGARGGLENR